MHIATFMKLGLLLSVVLATDVAALETMTIYQTQALKVTELHRVKKGIDIIVVELDKLERLEAELTRQAKIAPNAKESDGERAVRGQLNQLTLSAVAQAWDEVVQAQVLGVDLSRLPAVVFHGEVYHEVHDIRSILKP